MLAAAFSSIFLTLVKESLIVFMSSSDRGGLGAGLRSSFFTSRIFGMNANVSCGVCAFGVFFAEAALSTGFFVLWAGFFAAMLTLSFVILFENIMALLLFPVNSEKCRTAHFSLLLADNVASSKDRQVDYLYVDGFQLKLSGFYS
jgi:hypothetical protein